LIFPQTRKTTAHGSPVESCLQQVRKAEFHWASKAESSKGKGTKGTGRMVLHGWEAGMLGGQKALFKFRWKRIAFCHFHLESGRAKKSIKSC
jgi:hypothetical protein